MDESRITIIDLKRIEIAKAMLPQFYTAQRELCRKYEGMGHPEKWDTLIPDTVKAAYEIADEVIKQAEERMYGNV